MNKNMVQWMIVAVLVVLSGGNICCSEKETNMLLLTERLLEAIEKNDTNTARLCIENNVRVDLPSIVSGEFPLIKAVCAERVEIVTLLVEAKADVNKKAFVTGATALHCASAHKSTKIAQCLLGAKADCYAKDYAQRTPLLIAHRAGNKALKKLMCDAVGIGTTQK